MAEVDVRGAVDRVLAALREAGRSEVTIRGHQVVLDRFALFLAGWFASESMTQIRVLISPHLQGFRLDQEGVFDDRAGTFSRQRGRPSSEAVSLALAEV